MACGSRTGLGTSAPEAGMRDGGPAPRDGGVDAQPVDACAPGPEFCNGFDDDCDGVADDGIACFWLNDERVTALDTTTCGAAWYSYDAPDAQSANPRPDIRSRDAVVVAIQHGASCTGASVALIADVPGDGTGGELQVSFVVDSADAAGLLVSDESHECMFEASSGRGICDFAWVGCCTDGLLVGPIMRAGCVEIEVGFQVGVDELFFVDGSGRLIELAFGSVMEICVQILPTV